MTRPGLESSSGRTGETYRNKPLGYYDSVNMLVAQRISGAGLHILDVGCGNGRLIEYLKERNDIVQAFGIEGHDEAAGLARQHMDQVWEGNVEQLNVPIEPGSLDYIICADVLEHLVNPMDVVKRLKPLLKQGGSFIVSMPNINYIGVIWSLIAHNDFKYQPSGLMDATHLRWFTQRSITRAFAAAGLSASDFRYGFGSTLRRRTAKVMPPLRRFLGEQMVFSARTPA